VEYRFYSFYGEPLRRDKLKEKLNHWTLWRPVKEVLKETNRLLKGWAGYFHWRQQHASFRLDEPLRGQPAATLALAQEQLQQSPMENKSATSFHRTLRILPPAPTWAAWKRA
jgi:hypothetical protein